jgi:hypothetical protein
MQTVYLVALAVSASLAVLGVFNRHFDDNFLQRCGLAVIGFAACSDLYLAIADVSCCEASNGKDLFVIGFSVYGLGTLLKVAKHRDRI